MGKAIIMMKNKVTIINRSSLKQFQESRRVIPQVNQAKFIACTMNLLNVSNYIQKSFRAAHLILQQGKDQNARKESARTIVKYKISHSFNPLHYI